MEDDEGELLLWKSDSAPQSMVSITVGRVMATLLAARPKKLHDAVSGLSPDHRHGASLDSLDQSLWFLHKYVRDAVQNHASLDEILVPMIEHTLRFKDKNWKRGGQVMVLLNWLFLDELTFQSLIKNLADIIVRKDDRYVALGWCILVRSLVEFESVPTELSLNGLRERFKDMLKVFSSCIPRLTCILSKGSILQEGFELPSRLSVCAADCVVSLTNALTRKPEAQTRQKRLNTSSSYQQVTFFSNAVDDQREKPISSSSKDSNLDMEYLLWDQLKDLVILVQRLLAWSMKSRPLHAKGLEQVLKWLQEINVHYGSFRNEAGKEKAKISQTGALLLSSCWRHYSILLFLDDCRFSQHYEEWLNQYLSGIQYYSGHHTGESIGNKDGRETIIFFLNCLCLLLGRLDSKKFESTVSEYGSQISQVLLSQFHSTDEDVITEVVSIFKAVFLNPKLSSGDSITDIRQLDVVMPSLLNLLDERDVTARAVIILIAESCLMSRDNDQFLLEVFKRFDSDSIIQRRNAIDVISEIVQMSSNKRNLLTQSAWQDIAKQLIKCLEDEEILIRKQAADLLPCIDPSLVLPSLVRLVYSSNDKVLASAEEALVGVLKCHNQNIGAILLLLDCVSDFGLNTALSNTGGKGQGSRLQSDRVLSLIPKWSHSVQDWKLLIGSLIDKMFAEPSNAVLVRFLSIINEHLVKATDVILKRILSYVKGQKEIDESFYTKRGSQNVDISPSVQQSLFERLCPLLVIRMLPLEVFNDLSMSVMYGQLPNRAIINDMDIVDPTCVVELLLNRAFSKFEFDDVRKLAAELCGRIHPQVLYPYVSLVLEDAVGSHHIPGIKACLFSMCTSLAVRGEIMSSHFDIFEIVKTLEVVLSWPSQDGDEVSKSQHGCIDCMALMICAELQGPNSCSTSNLEKIDLDKKKGHASVKGSILGYVIHQLIGGRKELVSTYDLDQKYNNTADNSTPVSFRLCMANVLISACQKLSDSRKKRFAREVLPRLVSFAKVTSTQVDIRAACIGVIFSAVYHLKSAILPYANDIFRVSVNALKSGQEKERIAGAKLMVSLMSSEDPILDCISGELLEARDVLSSVSSLDPSIEVQQICQKMLQCLLSP
ncbi:uncharacterized protein LOC111803391 isoform X3 [Cucurbita pepo subsp. pepo]|uniref:uncharacterized protein LOC111803391 isoform X3 n=1 Tax=Cucurbita pepo subsp. pepo TaxID=3664 RepID=UPI000C9D6675|nr:uncharacterized protein LOC111803391 isoform X3 [Cucurbita pepo subsp. pepo]